MGDDDLGWGTWYKPHNENPHQKNVRIQVGTHKQLIALLTSDNKNLKTLQVAT